MSKKLRDVKSEGLIKNTMGSCETFLEKDEVFGHKWFIKNAIEFTQKAGVSKPTAVNQDTCGLWGTVWATTTRTVTMETSYGN